MRLEKKGFVLTLDAAISIAISIVLFSTIALLLQGASSDEDGGLSSSVTVYLSSLDAAGFLNDVVIQNNETLLSELTVYPEDQFCLNLTLYNDSTMMSAQTPSCVSGNTVVSSTTYVYNASEDQLYKIVALGWKR